MWMNFSEFYKNQIRQMIPHTKRLNELIWRKLSTTLQKWMPGNIAVINRTLTVFIYCHVFRSDSRFISAILSDIHFWWVFDSFRQISSSRRFNWAIICQIWFFYNSQKLIHKCEFKIKKPRQSHFSVKLITGSDYKL